MGAEKGAEAIVGEPTHVAGEHVPQIGDAILKHGQPIDAEAEREPLPDFVVKAAVAQHVGVNHAAPNHLQPVGAFADLKLALGAVTLDVHLRGGLGEGKMMRAKTRPHPIDLKEAGDERLKRPFEVPHVDATVDHQPFHLKEHRRVGLIPIFAVGAPGNHDADRRVLAPGEPGRRRGVASSHGAHLHGGGVSAQKPALAVRPGMEEEGVVRVAGRMFGRKVQSREVVKVILNVRPFGDGEPKVGEDGDHLLHHLQGGVDRSLTARRRRQREINALCQKLPLQGLGLERLFARADHRAQPVAKSIDQRALFPPLPRAHGP